MMIVMMIDDMTEDATDNDDYKSTRCWQNFHSYILIIIIFIKLIRIILIMPVKMGEGWKSKIKTWLLSTNDIDDVDDYYVRRRQ